MKQMFSRAKVTDTGDSDWSVGDVVEHWEFEEEAKLMEADGKMPPKVREMVLGIKESALSRRSFLSAASFEQTTKILINAALKGSVDTLRGLKENVILGRLIPAGTCFPGSKKAQAIDAVAGLAAHRRTHGHAVDIARGHDLRFVCGEVVVLLEASGLKCERAAADGVSEVDGDTGS